ncbi:MAG TPA: CBS domain-containing protein [Longimicrobiales bacterium]|nr:CBS domain-containing protein [Longimicrobiales bacterium]
MTVATICTRLPETVSGTDTVLRAAQRMLSQDVGTLVVADAEGVPEGIVTDRDIVIRCVAEEQAPEKTRIRDVMTHDVHTVHEDESVEAALEMMADKQVRRLIVVNSAGRVSGIVSLDDFLEGVVAAAEDIGRLLRRQVHV